MASNEFPWLAFIYFDNSDEDGVWCSGAIIGTKWILTAASCLDVYRYDKVIFLKFKHQLNQFKFRKGSHVYGFIGDHNADMTILPPNRNPINNLIDTVILHPNWNRTTRNADIALVRLKTDLKYNGTFIFSFLNKLVD